MKVWKLVSGILSIIFFALVAFQSCAAGIGDAIVEATGETSNAGGSGMLVAGLMLAGGIVSIATRKSPKKGGNISLIILFGIAALVGFTGAGFFQDLVIWAGWCAINAILAIVALVTNKNVPTNE